jgi:hypothetical protein
MDTDIGTELFAGYENDFKLIVADISSKLQALQDQDGEARKASVRAVERSVEEAEEIVRTPPALALLLIPAIDRSDGDGGHEHTQSTALESICSSPGAQGDSREVKDLGGSYPSRGMGVMAEKSR